LIEPLYKEDDNSEIVNCWDIKLVPAGSKLLRMEILLRLRYAVNKVLREEQYSFEKDRWCVHQINTLR